MNKKNESKYLFLIVIIFIAACIETDIYLPAFPDMMERFSASEGAIQGLLTWNFLGICLSGPLYGPLSDSFGRKKPLMLALLIFFLGSLITIGADTMNGMLVGRVLQGIGSGGCFTLGTTIIFDVFQKERALAAVNRLNMIIPIIMAAAPLAGGYLNATFGFRSNFILIAALVFASLLLCWGLLKESLPTENRAPFQGKTILRDFKLAFSSGSFWQISVAISLIFAGYIAFLSGSSVLFVVDLGVSKTIFPFLQASLLAAWVLASLVLNGFVARKGMLKVKKIGTLLCIAGASIFLLCSLFTPLNAYLLTSGMLVYTFGANWVFGLYFPEGMEILPHIKGIAASLLTSLRLLIAAAIVGMVSFFYNATIYPLTFLVVGTIFIVLPILFAYEKRQLNRSVEEA